MTTEEFNKKWSNYLEKGHYGLVINNPEVITYLDKVVFPNVTKAPGFKYMQIKNKFGFACFYCRGLCTSEVKKIEVDINKIIKDGSK